MDSIVKELREFVAIPSVSSNPVHQEDVVSAAQYLDDLLVGLGAETIQVQEDDEKAPIILGKLGDDPNKPTIALYGHYDVQPAHIDDGWNSEPFNLTEKDGNLFARGATDDKGPIIATLFAIKELPEQPVNYRFIYEGEEESGSGGFETTLRKHKDWVDDSDVLLVMDNYWLGDDRPCLTYGLRGLCYMSIKITGPDSDLHSGVEGGAVQEPLNDLIFVLSRLVNSDGRAQIAGFYDDVAEVTNEEEQLYEDLEFNVEKYERSLGVEGLHTLDKTSLLMKRSRFPTLSIHGIEGAYAGPGGKTVIPHQVIGKVSMRIVPNQDPQKIADLFTAHVEQEFTKLQSPNDLSVSTLSTGDWWLGDPDNPYFKAAEVAIEEVWGQTPMYTREGGSIPIIPFMEDLLECDAVMLPIGQASDGAHSQNEKIRLKNLENGKEVLKHLFKNLNS